MRKILLTVFALCSLTAMADDYNYLEVVQTNGRTTDVALNTLRKITFSAGEMVLTTDNGEQTIPLEGLDKMFFSGTATDMNRVKTDDSVECIYTIDGRRIATTRPEMLQGGIYIIRRADGTTIKTARR